MDAIERLGRLLQERLGQYLPFRQMADSHPLPKTRLARLDAFARNEDPPTSVLLRYAEAFLNDIVDYAEALDDTALRAPLAETF